MAEAEKGQGAGRKAGRFGLTLPTLIILSILGVVAPAAARIPIEQIVVIHAYPHDPQAYTEGLFYRDGFLYESTGLVGQSTIRKVRLDDGVVVQTRAFPPGVFGEGIVDWDHQIIGVTWQDHTGVRWNADSFAEIGRFTIEGEGWGLTHDGHSLILSDGTPNLHFLDPLTLQETRRLAVTEDGQPLYKINEVEWVKGDILANVWLTNLIARIDPLSGVVKAWINLAGLPETLDRAKLDDIPNGIAYDAAHDRLFVTGKHWPHVYEIRIQEPH